MNVVAVIASPHRNGPGARLSMQAVQGARSAGHTVDVFYLNDMNVRGCQGRAAARAKRRILTAWLGTILHPTGRNCTAPMR